jgi:hypothetical protein
VTAAEAVEAAALGVSAALNIVWAGYAARLWLERRRMAAQWKERLATGDHTVIILPSDCTCCPEHGPGIAAGDYMKVRPADTRDPDRPEQENRLP